MERFYPLNRPGVGSAGAVFFCSNCQTFGGLGFLRLLAEDNSVSQLFPVSALLGKLWVWVNAGFGLAALLKPGATVIILWNQVKSVLRHLFQQGEEGLHLRAGF